MIDLCPVGALTSKPYAFNARPWELKKTESIDVMDALGSAIRVDARGPTVMRVLPRVNEEINEEWISDKTRYAWDGLGRQRLDRPYVRENGKLQAATWDEALEARGGDAEGSGRRRSASSPATCGRREHEGGDGPCLAGREAIDCRQDGAKLGLAAAVEAPRESWLFNSTIVGIDDADAILLVGTNPRLEAAVLNARLRKAWLRGGAGGADRRARRPDLRLQLSRRGPGQPEGPQGRTSGVRRAGARRSAR